MSRSNKPTQWMLALTCLTAVTLLAFPSLPVAAHGEDHAYAGPGPVKIPAGHVAPANGKMVLVLDDAVSDYVGILVCQGPPGDIPCPPIHPYVSNDSWIRCNGILLDVEHGWDPGMDLWVYIGSPFDTWALGFGVPCGDPRPGTVGHILHYPTA